MMKHTKMLSFRGLLLLVALLMVFAFGATVSAAGTYTVEFYAALDSDTPIATVTGEDGDLLATLTAGMTELDGYAWLYEPEFAPTTITAIDATKADNNNVIKLYAATLLQFEVDSTPYYVEGYSPVGASVLEIYANIVDEFVTNNLSGADLVARYANCVWTNDTAGTNYTIVKKEATGSVFLKPAKIVQYFDALTYHTTPGDHLLFSGAYPLELSMQDVFADGGYLLYNVPLTFRNGMDVTQIDRDYYNAYGTSDMTEEILRAYWNKERLLYNTGYSVSGPYDSTWIEGLDILPTVGEYYDYDAAYNNNTSTVVSLYNAYNVTFYDDYYNFALDGYYPIGTSISAILPSTTVVDPTAWVEERWEDHGDYWTVSYLPIDDDRVVSDSESNYFYPGYLITFIAEGKVVHEGYFTVGNPMEDGPMNGAFALKYYNEPVVPNKVGYYGRWATYSLEASDIVVRAQYTAKTYRVSFNANGGEGTMNTQLLSWDKEEALTANAFTRDGYTFAGWNTEADGTGDAYTDGELVTNLTKLGSVTLYAQWTEDAPEVYTATFVVDGSVVATVTFEEGATALTGVPAVPAKNGYDGVWEDYTLADADITINAVYTAKNYEIKFDANGGEGDMENQIVTYDETVILKANVFTFEGYNFIGWNTKADGTGIHFEPGASVKNLTTESTITLYAEWEQVEEEETTTVEDTTTAPVEEDKSNVGLIIGISVVAGLAVIGGVVGYLIYKKKKTGAGQ